MAQAWSAEENEVIVAEYFRMLEQELAGQSYTKSQFNQRVQQLTGRGKSAVEYKFQNVSAALQELHAPWVRGYVPAKHYQSSLMDAIAAYLEEKSRILELMRLDAQSPAVPRVDVIWNLIPAPAVPPRPGRAGPRILHTDFVMLEAANTSLGLSGEELVLTREREILTRAGASELAERVEHVSVVRGDGLGYDISSFAPDGRPRFIEVKTTRRGEQWPMCVSRNEVSVSRDLDESYVIARVFDFAQPKVGLYELPGPIEETCWLEPETYRALPKAS